MFLHRPAAPGGVAGSRVGLQPTVQLAQPVKLYDTSMTLAASGSQVVAANNPSPNAAYAQSGQVAYEISLSGLAAAGTGNTNPFIEATLNFYDDDSAGAQPVAPPVSWYLPVGFGASGSTPVQVAGTGPLRGQYMSLTLANTDTAVGCTVAVKLRGVARSYARDDWRWPGGGQVPGYIAPNLGQGTLVLASINTTVGQGLTITRLLPLFAGKVRTFIIVQGSLVANSVLVTVTPVNSGQGAPVYSYPNIGDTVQVATAELSLPRDCCTITILNASAGGGPAPVQCLFVAEEY